MTNKFLLNLLGLESCKGRQQSRPVGVSFASRLRILGITMLCLLTVGVGDVWGDESITEDFENDGMTAETTYNSTREYTAANSNAEIAWFVEHGCVATSDKLRDTKSMHMRAYYARYAATTTWNGNLPYLESKTAVTGLKSISFYAATSAPTYLSFDILYSTDGSTWSAMKTTAATPADATAQTFTNSSAKYTYNIPSPNSSYSYYIKIAVNSGSTHVYKTSSGGANYTFRVDDIVFTYSAGTTVSLSKAATSNGSVKWSKELEDIESPNSFNIYLVYFSMSKIFQPLFSVPGCSTIFECVSNCISLFINVCTPTHAKNGNSVYSGITVFIITNEQLFTHYFKIIFFLEL